LIRKPLLREISAISATTQIDRGAQWLDIRYPEEHASSILGRSQNIPFNILCLQANRLDKNQRYVACSDDPTQSAVGAFLLLERGLSVVYLDDEISALLKVHPSMLALPTDNQRPSSTVLSTVEDAKRRVEPEPTASSNEDTTMDDRQSDSNRFENTIDKIDRLYSQKEWEEEKAARVPQADYAHTVTGHRLADLIDEIDETGETLSSEKDPHIGEPSTIPQARLDDVIDIAPDGIVATTGSASNVLLVDTHAPMPVYADETLHGELFEDNESLSQIIQDFEFRLRDHVEAVALQRTESVQQRYQDKLKRMRTAAALEVRRRQELSRERYALQYKKKELQLRAHYKKLMALANKISEQKAQLQQAKKQFEDKLSAANAVYKQVEDMRKSLRQHIDDLPPTSEAERRHTA
jgi:rhodanese-related sulfurtransferase/methionine-rich copper-binding protein CopC